MQLSLFDYDPDPVVVVSPPPPAKRPKPKKTVYRCRCGRAVTLYIQAVRIICGCGRVMREED